MRDRRIGGSSARGRIARAPRRGPVGQGRAVVGPSPRGHADYRVAASFAVVRVSRFFWVATVLAREPVARGAGGVGRRLVAGALRGERGDEAGAGPRGRRPRRGEKCREEGLGGSFSLQSDTPQRLGCHEFTRHTGHGGMHRAEGARYTTQRAGQGSVPGIVEGRRRGTRRPGPRTSKQKRRDTTNTLVLSPKKTAGPRAAKRRPE